MRATPILVSLLLLSACGPAPVTLQFAPRLGSASFSCSDAYPGLGTAGSTVRILDFKMYVHDVALVHQDGTRELVALEQDGTWQREGVALLDFEDGTGSCTTGSPETRSVITGTASRTGGLQALELTIGVPGELNHLDGATAAAPLNVPGMWWSWQGGYKYLRLDVETDLNPTFFVHLGATGCEGTPSEGYACAADNRLTLRFEDFDPARQELVVDVAALLSGSDVDREADMVSDFISGCMSSPTDAECPPLFERLGFPGDAPTGVPRFLRAE